MEIWYPPVEKIVEYNALALSILKAKKSDKSELLNRSKVVRAIETCREKEGDIYDKAVVLLENLVRLHPFASGNRRTAFLAVKHFLLMNRAKLNINDDPANARTLLGIREGFYTAEETKGWLKHGTIKEFKR